MSSYSSYIKAFKDAVENFTLDFNKPVVIFIDELDRSNPTFVIKLIEQLKHIFDINNLVFILTVNKHELSNTIKSCMAVKWMDMLIIKSSLLMISHFIL